MYFTDALYGKADHMPGDVTGEMPAAFVAIG